MSDNVFPASPALAAIATEDLESQITTLAGNLWAATARFLMLIGEFDRREGWVAAGIGSCAQWLSWHCGLSPTAAREHVRVARSLRTLPQVAAAFEAGELSYSKVRAITRMATPATEETLLMWARHGTAAQLERICRGYRTVKASEDPVRLHKQRALSYSFDEDGMVQIRIRLTPEMGAVAIRALEAAVEELRSESTSVPAEASEASEASPAAGRATDGPSASASPNPADVPAEAQSVREQAEYAEDLEASSPWERRYADAFARVTEAYLAGNRRYLEGAERSVIAVHIDPTTLVTGDGDRCHLAGGTPIAQEVARRLACDASLITILDGPNGVPLSIGRKSRIVPRRIRRALRMRDGGCRFPGCTARASVDAHHIIPWATGGPTSLENLVLLCRTHHMLLHEDGFTMEVSEEDGFIFRDPRGIIVAIPKTTGSADRLTSELRASGLEIGSDTCASRRDTNRPNYAWAVGDLLSLDDEASARNMIDVGQRTTSAVTAA